MTLFWATSTFFNRRSSASAVASNSSYRSSKLVTADGSADCVISNCVINLAPDKPTVFREMFRVLKPGGRVADRDREF